MIAKKHSTCDICKGTSDYDEDVLLFGEWMSKNGVTVHYFCLLLSTNLPQNGFDSAGILGFLMRDIRNEIQASDSRKCIYCGHANASISCVKCKCYFHLRCSREERCLHQFCDEFLSYCRDCTPMDDYKRQIFTNPPKNTICGICFTLIQYFQLNIIVYGECCKKGFAHRLCMQKYALVSGYYLNCIWCRSRDFRKQVRMQGIFVPDRDAAWEREKYAYQELHRKHMRCDWEECICKKGREYSMSNWRIIYCTLCGSFGAHRQCMQRSGINIKPKGPNTFKCLTCRTVEQKLENERSTKSRTEKIIDTLDVDTCIDTTCYVQKSFVPMEAELTNLTPTFSQEESFSSNSNIAAIDTQPKSSIIENNVCQILEPPLQLKSFYRVRGETYFYLDVYEIDETKNCVGTITLRFDDTDPRIQDKTQTSLECIKVEAKDIHERSLSRGIYNFIDDVIQDELYKDASEPSQV